MLGSSKPPQGAPLPTDPTQLLQQIARNTAELSRWIKFVFGAVLLLIVVTAVLFV